VTHRHRLLIVDDNPDILETFGELFSEHGYRVITARQGAEALDSLEQRKTAPCLILLDFLMPVMNGREFLVAVASRPELGILVMSAESSVRDEIRRDPRVMGFIDKLMPSEKLIELVARSVLDCAKRRETGELAIVKDGEPARVLMFGLKKQLRKAAASEAATAARLTRAVVETTPQGFKVGAVEWIIRTRTGPPPAPR
jgi:CheY-like chemotaxis protein